MTKVLDFCSAASVPQRFTFFVDKNSQNSRGVKKNNKSKETGARSESRTFLV